MPAPSWPTSSVAAGPRSTPIRSCAERLLEIIGEATNLLKYSTTNRHADVPWRDIAGLRIVLAHHYHRVHPDQVWVTATSHVPNLTAALSADKD